MVDLGLNYLNSLSLYIPEAIALIIMIGLVFLEATYSHGEKEENDQLFSLFGLFTVCIILYLNLDKTPSTAFFNAVAIDPFSSLMKLMMVLGTMGAIYLNSVTQEINTETKTSLISFVLVF